VVKDNARKPELFPPRLLLYPRLVARAERQILVELSRFLPRTLCDKGFMAECRDVTVTDLRSITLRQRHVSVCWFQL
jgi:hypothetical protein